MAGSSPHTWHKCSTRFSQDTEGVAKNFVIPYPASLCTFPKMRLSFMCQMVYNIQEYKMGLGGQMALRSEAKAHRR